MARPHARMTDVAALAGVSISTVSHVLNGTRRVAAETREKVLEAVNALEYQHDPTIRSLDAGTRPAVGIIGPLTLYASVADQLTQVAVAAYDDGMSPSLADSFGDVQCEAEIVASMAARNFDAIVICPTRGWRRHTLQVLRRHRIPFVVVEQFDPGVVAPQVGTDHREALTVLTGHLLDHGWNELLLLHSERTLAAGSEQLEGFIAAHEDRGLSTSRHQIIPGVQAAEFAYRAVMDLSRSGVAGHGLVVGASAMVPGVLAATHALGLSVGSDVAIAVLEDNPNYIADPAALCRAQKATGEVAHTVVAAVRAQLNGATSVAATPVLPARVAPRYHAGPSCGCRGAAGSGRLALPGAEDPTHEPRLVVTGHGRRFVDAENAVVEDQALITINPETGRDVQFPILHIRPRSGWVNDPNGIHRIGDTWHVFFQYNPAAPWHDHICWGHVTSRDLVTWHEEPIALRPRRGEADAAGCWSGVGLIHEGISSLVYSGVKEMFGSSQTVLAQQRADRSGWDPVGVVAEMPPDPRVRTMRDPFVFTFEGTTYAIFGAGFDDGRPTIALYDCTYWHDWKYLGPLVSGDDLVAGLHAPASVWECPQLVQLGERWVLIVSLWVEAEELMDHLTGVAYLVGDLKLHHGRPVFVPDDGGLVDVGSDFYAPQCVVDGERTLMWGWSWEGAGRSPLEIEASGYNGALTFPRELMLDQHGRMVVSPARELVGLRQGRIDVAAVGHARQFELEFQGEGFVHLLDDSTGEAVVSVDARGASGHVFVDGSLVEVFQSGHVARTSRHYPKQGYRVAADAGVTVTAWELGIPGKAG